ncbi:MAG: macrocin O-methyltransferase [Desulfobacter postgatei]|uniref:TylF/MycF/NovP-related O-methyltransferase n=1 Tax=Desulfobacter postgatei TaxID=2293 RepID=UPI0023EFD4A5|nr:TylF/MycF/NovP-related O-methyltransferase [Desulfobacter postgatei]MDD4274328.1 macrocin O-methyltransferase [Desulfobacter postgatei]
MQISKSANQQISKSANQQISKWFSKRGISRRGIKNILCRSLYSKWFLIPYWSPLQRRASINTDDPVRYGTVDLAIEQIINDKVPGSLAECGVFEGSMSKFIHERIPDKAFFLFDTFQGFDERDSEGLSDTRFRNTSEQKVLNNIGNTQNIIIRKGFFPETSKGLEDEDFAFVMIDFDKYKPTLAALEFFYQRTNSGGFIFVHDYNSPESNWACSRALNEFLSDKTEKPILIPDSWGTALFRKI